MTKVIYTSAPERINLNSLNPWFIIVRLYQYRELIFSMTAQNFRSMYKSSYLGVAWQVVLPLIMLCIFYFVFGVVLGGRFTSIGTESKVDYALALFVGLGFFNFVSQNIGSSTSLILSNQAYVKTLSFPLEVLSITAVLTSFITLLINIAITLTVYLVAKHNLYFTSINVIFYLSCVFMMTLGVSWLLSAVGVFFRDISAIVSPLTTILMFMCPIFYPASMVPEKIKWIVKLNPLAVIIEDVRASILYNVWPSFSAMAFVFIFSLLFALVGYSVFIYSKATFADVI